MKSLRNFFFLFLILFLFTTFNPSNTLSIFPVTKIEVKSDFDIDNKNLKNKLLPLYHTNLLRINLNDVKDKINDEIIENITIKKKYPNTLKVIVKNKAIIGIYNMKQRKYFILSDNQLINFSKKYYDDNLPNIFGNYKKFNELSLRLSNLNFDTKNIKNFYYFEIGRWDILLKDDKLIKLPVTGYEESIRNFLSLDKKTIKNYSSFDYRIKDQLILK